MFLYGRAALNEKTDNVTIKASYPFFSLTDVLVETFTKTLRFVSVDFNLSLIIFSFSTVGLLFTVVKIRWCTKRPTGFGLCDVQMLVPAAGHATVPHGPARSCCFKYLFLVMCIFVRTSDGAGTQTCDPSVTGLETGESVS